jgi:hypothetical protein
VPTVIENFEGKSGSKIIVADGSADYKVIPLTFTRFSAEEKEQNINLVTRTIGDYLRQGYAILSAAPVAMGTYYRQTTYVLGK